MDMYEDIALMCAAALEHLGHETQATKIMEELYELGSEISKYCLFDRNDPADIPKVADELTDVQIVLIQLCKMLDIPPFDIDGGVPYKFYISKSTVQLLFTHIAQIAYLTGYHFLLDGKFPKEESKMHLQSSLESFVPILREFRSTFTKEVLNDALMRKSVKFRGYIES